MSAAHTPGPWRRGSDEPLSPELFSEVYAENGYCLAIAQTSHERGKAHRESCEIARANAQLMAAAPEMLAAAQSFVAHLKRVGIPNDDEPFVDALIAAIAKATGTQA